MDRAGHCIFVRRLCAGHERWDLAGGGGMMFTPEELAEMVAADAEIEKEFRLTQEDLDRSRELDLEAKFQALPAEKQKLAKYQKAYYEANREKLAKYQKAYREANREKVRERARNYMRAYRTKKRAAAGAGTPTTAKK